MSQLSGSAGGLHKVPFQAGIALFTVIPVLSSIARLVIRLRYHGGLSLGDGFVLFATASLIATAAITFYSCDHLFFLESVFFDQRKAYTKDDLQFLPDLNILVFTSTFLVWVVLFLIKFSFLALLQPLVWNVSRNLKRYFLAVIGVNILGFILVTLQVSLQHFNNCPNALGPKALDNPPVKEKALKTRLWATLGVDLGSDLLILSIPIILLRMSRLKLRQKFRIASILCLSTAMVAVAIARAAGGTRRSFRKANEYTLVWSTLFLHIEAGTAVLVASVATFRTAFAKDRNSTEEKCQQSIFVRLLSRMSRSSSMRHRDVENKKEASLPPANITAPTMATLRNFIRRHGREPGLTTFGSVSDPLDDYHDFMKKERVQSRVMTDMSPTSEKSLNSLTIHTHPSDIA
ncbi:hypothetical protein P154DRAFT_246727 [Amniculicola lignicola CBS 123094]|uniref:Rhodopsin domain-containing protein n=1 Tax=Amniculicola lignicola CBS 123094 TaxID=1392246 RepID=A0A6A5W9Q4_9PLEO|nr:hypothetical protein P154DRAFT_246727 [Amniculicola lignicola CBS 123094]